VQCGPWADLPSPMAGLAAGGGRRIELGLALTLPKDCRAAAGLETAVKAVGGVVHLGRPLRPSLAGDGATGRSGGGLAESGEEQRRLPDGEVETACSRRPFTAVDDGGGLLGRNGAAQVSAATHRGLSLTRDHTTRPKGVGGDMPGSG
jgi:hypothetical protein